MGKTVIKKGRFSLMNRFIFDVDGTLTPSRGIINRDFEYFLIDFAINNDMYLITGSDRPKTIEQVGKRLYNTCNKVYNCSGSDVWQGDKNIHTNEWKLYRKAETWLKKKIKLSEFQTKTGLHIEERPGMVNFSIVGRNANAEERAEYVKWDQETSERKVIAKEFNGKFKDLQAVVGGETGIDIFPVGSDKGQIIKDFIGDTIYFFGDRMDEAGNDYPLGKEITQGSAISVMGWKDTYDKLLLLKVLGIAK
jgi:phosphomannomutase